MTGLGYQAGYLTADGLRDYPGGYHCSRCGKAQTHGELIMWERNGSGRETGRWHHWPNCRAPLGYAVNPLGPDYTKSSRELKWRKAREAV